MSAWHPITPDDSPNPIVAERPTRDGGTARLYANGMVDAVDGSVYSLSPGFESWEELDAWIVTKVTSEGVTSVRA